jgi:hypothetical protein
VIHDSITVESNMEDVQDSIIVGPPAVIRDQIVVERQAEEESNSSFTEPDDDELEHDDGESDSLEGEGDLDERMSVEF